MPALKRLVEWRAVAPALKRLEEWQPVGLPESGWMSGEQFCLKSAGRVAISVV